LIPFKAGRRGACQHVLDTRKHNLLSFILWYRQWLIDSDFRWRGQWLRRSADEAFGISSAGGIQNCAPLFDGGGRETVVNQSVPEAPACISSRSGGGFPTAVGLSAPQVSHHFASPSSFVMSQLQSWLGPGR
jgi:hypothetical protein